MALLRCAAKFDFFLSLDCAPALHPGAIQGKEGIKFCHLATMHMFARVSSRNLGVKFLTNLLQSALRGDQHDGDPEPHVRGLSQGGQLHLSQVRNWRTAYK